nr:L-lactate dehydrogenase [Haloplasma contractile]
MHDDIRRVVLIGTGFVGMSYAYSMLNQGISDELVLIDIDHDKAEGEAMDLNHGMAFAPKNIKIWAGTYDDCESADIIVITAGANQKEGETRLDLVHKNKKIMKGIIGEIDKSGFNGILLIASNPVDVMTYVAYKESGLDKSKIIGSGTTLDSARLRYELSDYLNINSKNIHAYIIGEHGDSEFPIWSNASIGVKPLLDVINEHDEYKYEDLDQIYKDVRDAAYEIIKRKKATYYGIGMSLAQVTKAILNDSNSIYTISSLVDDYYGVTDLYIGIPCIINRSGVREIIKLNLTKSDQERFKKSANILKDMIKEIGY